MPLKDHLLELRNRLFIAAVGLLIGSIAGWFLYQPVLDALVAPLTELAKERPEDLSPNFGNVSSPFDFKLKISVFIGVFLSSPVWIYQIWAFIAPGLKKGEKRYAAGFVLTAIPLFFAGAAFGYWFMPVAVKFFVSFTPEGFSNLIDVQLYLTFIMQIILAFGICFLVPLILVAMNFMGLMSAKTMLSGWRWMVVLSFTFSAFVTPTGDVVTMFLLALPLMLLFAIAVGVSFASDRMRRKRLQRELGDDYSEDMA